MDRFHQMVFEYKMQISAHIDTILLDSVNSILSEGYEIMDIIPILEASGGAMFTISRGLYTHNVLFVLNPSEKQTEVRFRTIRKERDYIEKLNNALLEESEKGNRLLKLITLNGFVDPKAEAGIGKGTYGFGIFFVSDR